MTKRLRTFLKDPPTGSKTRAAMDFGIDITLTVRNMFTLTPTERVRKLERAVHGLSLVRNRSQRT